jgi:endoglucanase
MKHLFLVCFAVVTCSTFSQGFLHRDGQNIVDGNGKNIVLRGLGLGGWMVQEGYMIQTGAFAGSQYKIKQKITDLIGTKNTEEFYKAYKKNGITKRDIDSLAAWGFNSIRLPMHYNLYTPAIETEKEGQITWLEEGFKMTDDLVKWCAANKIHLILDLHAAPGGQGKDAAISDYDDSKPSLWESAANQDKMVALWEKLAERYKDNPWIGGYDIINEPNWNFTGTNQNGCDETSNAPLRALMMRVTKAIRAIDTNHLIFIEGNCWGNNYNGIFPLWDENMALSFHKYWNTNDVGSIQTMLNYRTQYNVPIWLGESGENSNVWFEEALSLIETNNIGWAFWPMKKIENLAGVTSVTKPEGYDQILEYWKNGGTKPDEKFSKKVLMQMADNYKMDNLTIRYDVIDAMFRQVQTNETKKHKKHSLPGIVYATEYDLGQNEFAYSDTDVANYDGTKFTKWNKGGKMRNDGVDIIECKDKISNGYAVSFIEDKEWLQYTVDVKEQANYDVSIQYSSEKEGGKLYLEVDGVKISESIELPVSGGVTTWKTATLKNVMLKQGVQKIRVHFEGGNFNFNFLEFQKIK